MSVVKMICINCPLGCELDVSMENGTVKVSGNTCRRGEIYAENEMKDPKRTVTTTAKVENGGAVVVPVKTDRDIAKGLMFEVINVINQYTFNAPIHTGDILIENILGTDVNIIATGTVLL